MKERIKLLAKQAVEETQQLMIMEYKNFESKLYERFAELIAQDCLIIIAENAGGPYDIAMTDETRKIWNIWIEIATHFGVKQ